MALIHVRLYQSYTNFDNIYEGMLHNVLMKIMDTVYMDPHFL